MDCCVQVGKVARKGYENTCEVKICIQGIVTLGDP